jgi:hypothetical protein
MKALFAVPALTLGIPQPLLLAIARVESNLYPWTLNIEGRSFRFDSKEEALLKAQEARVAGRSFDVGLMQVNDWWLRKYGLPLEAALDPLTNIYIGGWILKQELDRHGGDLRAAVGAYHSPKPARAERYAKLVFGAVQDGPLHQVAPRPEPTVSKKNTPPSECPQPEPSPAAVMLIVSKHKTLAQSQSLKASATAISNSMKVKL